MQCNDEIRALEATNRKLREQLSASLDKFDKEKELYEEINYLKAKVKGHEEMKKYSRAYKDF